MGYTEWGAHRENANQLVASRQWMAKINESKKKTTENKKTASTNSTTYIKQV
jgi:hypothetical protein